MMKAGFKSSFLRFFALKVTNVLLHDGDCEEILSNDTGYVA